MDIQVFFNFEQLFECLKMWIPVNLSSSPSSHLLLLAKVVLVTSLSGNAKRKNRMSQISCLLLKLKLEEFINCTILTCRYTRCLWIIVVANLIINS